MVHPDKHTDPELHATAERNFNRVHEAYEILSDPQKRSVYDSFGFQGLLSGLEIGSKYQSPEEFRKQFEKLLQREVCSQ
jgi:DnaJ-class molecular chaperone